MVQHDVLQPSSLLCGTAQSPMTARSILSFFCSKHPASSLSSSSVAACRTAKACRSPQVIERPGQHQQSSVSPAALPADLVSFQTDPPAVSGSPACKQGFSKEWDGWCHHLVYQAFTFLPGSGELGLMETCPEASFRSLPVNPAQPHQCHEHACRTPSSTVAGVSCAPRRHQQLQVIVQLVLYSAHTSMPNMCLMTCLAASTYRNTQLAPPLQ